MIHRAHRIYHNKLEYNCILIPRNYNHPGNIIPRTALINDSALLDNRSYTCAARPVLRISFSKRRGKYRRVARRRKRTRNDVPQPGKSRRRRGFAPKGGERAEALKGKRRGGGASGTDGSLKFIRKINTSTRIKLIHCNSRAFSSNKS